MDTPRGHRAAGGLRGTLLAIGAVLPSAAAWLYFVALDGDPRAPVVYVASKVVQFALPFAWLAAGGGPLLPLRRRGVAAGLGCGAVLAAAALLVFRGLAATPLAVAAGPRIAAKVASFGIHGVAGYLALAGILSGVHSLLEEIYWRAFVFGGLRGAIGTPAALVASSVLFAAHHAIVVRAYTGPGAVAWIALFTLAVAAAGALWAELYRRSGSLLPGWASHLVADAALFWIGWQLMRG